MTFKQLIAIADKAYPDGMVMQAYKAEQGPPPKEDVGDTLAHFIVRELKDTYDAKASKAKQLEEACRVMDRAYRELYAVRMAFAWGK